MNKKKMKRENHDWMEFMRSSKRKNERFKLYKTMYELVYQYGINKER